MDISFVINLYDKDGDIYENGIFIFVEERTIIKFKNIEELNDFANTIKNNIIPEIKENVE